MQSSDLVLLRRKETFGTTAWTAWGVWLLVQFCGPAGSFSPMRETFLWYVEGVAFALGWLFTFAWVGLDQRSRRGRYGLWTVFALMTGPAGFVLYYLTRNPTAPVCWVCGSVMHSSTQACPTCQHASLLARARLALSDMLSGLRDPLVRRPVERSKETAKHLAFALAAAAIITFLLGQYARPLDSRATLVGVIWALTAAAYWVLVAWWVYLDSAWRRMDGVPWAVLTLVTNVVGLVTYLVIRYPDPRSCGRCGASIPTGLKYCPFCGSEAEPMCPHCQAPIKSGWQFCPVCAARLTPSESTLEDPPIPPGIDTWRDGVTIAGSVLDAAEQTPIAGARVEIDSVAGGTSVTTNSLGRFQLSVPDQRPYVLVASTEGYTSQARPYSPGTKDARHLRFALHRTVRDQTNV